MPSYECGVPWFTGRKRSWPFTQRGLYASVALSTQSGPEATYESRNQLAHSAPPEGKNSIKGLYRTSDWGTNSEYPCYPFPRMARRHRRDDNNAKLSVEELKAFRQRLATVDRSALEIQYKVCHNSCRYDDMRVCSPEAIQQFVQVWRRLQALKGSAGLWA
jgi:hypothetical protein